MKLTPEEVRNLNSTLAALKEMTAAQIEQVSTEKRVAVDKKHVNELIEKYVTEDGFACLLLDTVITGRNCTCGVSCAQPCNYYMRCRESGETK